MRRISLVHEGVNQTDGVIIDRATIGDAEAQRRILERWKPGVRVFELSMFQWLVVFDEAEPTLATSSLGAPVVASNGGLIGAPGLETESNQLTWWAGGEECRVTLSALVEIDPAIWIDVATPVEVITPLPAPAVTPLTDFVPAPPLVNLRSVAGIATESDETRRVAAGLVSDAAAAQKQQRRRSRQRQQQRGSQQRGQGGTQQRRSKNTSSAIAKLSLRSPLRNQIGRRHQRYLERLTEQFREGIFDEALRNALPLNGLPGTGVTLRLPKRRESLALTGGSTGGPSTPFGATVQSHLTSLYQDAAKQLEAAGQIDEAAFVLAELLNNPHECVALLERHGRFATAANLAENRGLDSALSVRLWWLAGDRQRAMRLAVKTQNYHIVVAKLAESSAEEAHAFRLLWVDQLERSGNLSGAIKAGWPDAGIRPLLRNVVARGVALNDDSSLGFMAYRLALQPSNSNLSEFLDALHSHALDSAALHFAAEALASIDSMDPMIDREVCSAVARRVLATHRSVDATLTRSFNTIAGRADPALKADMPSLRKHSATDATIDIPSPPSGALAPFDVVPMPSGRVLVALGELGVRLLTADGRTAAQWPTPCHHLVPADHGNTVLFLTDRQPVVEVHTLDLITQTVRHYGTIRTALWAKSFDGNSWASIDERGIVFYDMLADNPTVSWRELEHDWGCHAIERSETELAAVVSAPPTTLYPEQRVMLWHWALPSMRLQERAKIDPVEQATGIRLASDATSVWERGEQAAVALDGRGAPMEFNLDQGASIRASGAFYGVRATDGVVTISQHIGSRAIARGPVRDPAWNMRTHGKHIALWSKEGNLIVLDHHQRTVRAAFALH